MIYSHHRTQRAQTFKSLIALLLAYMEMAAPAQTPDLYKQLLELEERRKSLNGQIRLELTTNKQKQEGLKRRIQVYSTIHERFNQFISHTLGIGQMIGDNGWLREEDRVLCDGIEGIQGSLMEAGTGLMSHIQSTLNEHRQRFHLFKNKEEKLQASLRGPTPTNNNDGPQCTICYEKTADHAIIGCGHVFCSPCIDRLLTHNCPVCRRSFSQTQRVYLGGGSNEGGGGPPNTVGGRVVMLPEEDDDELMVVSDADSEDD